MKIKFLVIFIFFLIGVNNIPDLDPYESIIKILILLSCLTIFIGNLDDLKKIKTKILKYWIINLILFDIYVLLLEIIRGNYLESSYFYTINLASFFLFLGYTVKQNITKHMYVYNFSVFILCLSLYFKYFNKIDFNRTQYIFVGKNFVGPMIVISLISIVYEVLFLKKNKKWLLLCPLEIYVLFSMKNRTGILSLLVALVYLFSKRYSIKEILRKLIVPLLIMITIFYRNIYDYLVWSLNLNHSISRNATRIESLTSGRSTLYIRAINKFLDNSLIGVGNYYVDNMYLNFLVSYGILGISFLIIFLYLLYEIFKLKIKGKIFVKSLLIAIIFPTILESVHPFGPGMSYFVIWVVLGNYLRKKDKFQIRRKKLELKVYNF